MYWTDYEGGRIRRANLDGSEVEDVIIELDSPSGLAIELGGDATIRLPCGLVFYPTEVGEGPEAMQQLMVVQDERVTVGPGETATLTPFVACIETEKAVPGLGAGYDPVEKASGELLKLAECICGEELADFEQDPMSAIGQQFMLQFTVWEVAEGRTFDEMMASAGASEGALASYADVAAMIEQAGEFMPGYIDWMEKCGIELGGE
jgi:beta-lactamase class A